jgi:hypothetical protein
MNYLIGSIKHCGRDRVNSWATSAAKFCSAKKILICLDEDLPQDLKSLENLDFEVVHVPTGVQGDVNISKFERHFVSKRYLDTVDENSTVLLTDTLDIVFQSDPFEWYKKNKTN